MVKIIYKLNGEKNKKCDFLDIPKEERIKLVKLIKNIKGFDKDIEVNIVKFGQLKYEVNNDHRILAKLSNDIQSMFGLGKRFQPTELYPPYKNEKICYCCHGNYFENTILTVLHEMNHFRNPFDLGLYFTQIKIDPTILSLETYLKCNIENALNEFKAEYRVVKQLSSYENFKERLINQAKGYLKRSFAYTLYHPSYLIDRNKIMQMFNAGFIKIFRFLGCWQGFYEIGDTSKLDEAWDDFILNFHNNLVNPEIFKNFFKHAFNLTF